MTAAEELQRLFRDTLMGDVSITALAYRVYDKVPASPFGPKTAYISFGPRDWSDSDADCIAAGEYTMQIDVWSRADGSLEASKLTDLVRKALHRKSLVLNENALVDTHVVLTRVFRDPDGETTHGVVQVTALVEEPD